MRVVVVGRTYMLRANRRKWQHLPPGIALTLVTPAQVQHTLRSYTVEVAEHWPHVVVPGLLSGRLSGFSFMPWALWNALREARPQLIQVDEEPVTPALLQVLLLKRLLGCRVVFFTWENLALRYRPIATLARRLALQRADGAIAGSQAAAEVPRYLNAIDALVLPSLSTPRWAEQFGHVLIEAMACGVPVVGSSSGAIPEVIGPAGLIFPEGRADLLAAHLRLLRDFPALQESVRWKGRARVLERFGDEQIAARTVAFWREVCQCE